MGAFIFDYWIWFFFAFLIGIATAWWVWARYSLPDTDLSAEPATFSASPAVEAPVVEAPATVAAPVTAMAAAPLVAPAVGEPDDLLLIKGVGPQLNSLLNGLGITRFDQIAGWSADDVQRIDAHLGVFKGRIVRDDWIEQAKLFAAGDMAGYAARFGNPESK
jgi:predicted flap endonuclease-1-like 5' DNA nuclease